MQTLPQPHNELHAIWAKVARLYESAEDALRRFIESEEGKH